MNGASTRTKKIFISDIHMGDARSFEDTADSYPYGWFRDNVGKLAQFLAAVISDPSISDLVILGDLFDEWVIPTYHDPVTSFGVICATEQNKPVIEALKAVAASPVKVTYVPGNHDMCHTVGGIGDMKSFMTTTFPGIQVACPDDNPVGLYTSGSLVAEHGHRYCLFNAPDYLAAKQAIIPAGYFVSRMVAYKVATTRKADNIFNIAWNLIPNYHSSPTFIADLLMSIAKDAGLNSSSAIETGGLPGFPPLSAVSDICKRYANLVDNWKKSKYSPDAGAAALDEMNTLWSAANTIYKLQSGGRQYDIVIFGHTHKPCIDQITDYDQYQDFDYENNPCKAIYANSGKWVDDPATYNGCSYVETEIVGDRHYVRVMDSATRKPIKDFERFVMV
jgi:UDP-2,3-diacylglucosamine pyrophosphatase LpxH